MNKYELSFYCTYKNGDEGYGSCVVESNMDLNKPSILKAISISIAEENSLKDVVVADFSIIE